MADNKFEGLDVLVKDHGVFLVFESEGGNAMINLESNADRCTKRGYESGVVTRRTSRVVMPCRNRGLMSPAKWYCHASH
jgi:hypothetical protein